MQRVIDVAGPSPDVVQVLNPIYSPRRDPYAHNVVWAASTRDQRVEEPLEDAEQRRRRKWEGEYRDWLAYGSSGGGALSEQLRSIRRVSDFNIAGSRMIETLQRAEEDEIPDEQPHPELESLESFLEIFEPPRKKSSRKRWGRDVLKVSTKKPIQKKSKRWAAGVLKKNPPLFDLSLSDVSVMSGQSRRAGRDSISQIRQAALQMKYNIPVIQWQP